MRERIMVDWLYNTNIHLATFIKAPLFEDITFWKIIDLSDQMLIDLTEQGKPSGVLE